MSFPRQRHHGTPHTPSSPTAHPHAARRKTLQRTHQAIARCAHASSAVLNHSTIHLAAIARHAARFNRPARQFGLAFSGSILLAGGAHARPIKKSAKAHSTSGAQRHVVAEENLRGAWAWTSGSQTYLRIRPGAHTPAIAKVPQNSKMFVWGKYNGWYRVETLDHKFGWVYHAYLNCPKAHKIAYLSPRKARSASDKASDQTLYGSPDTLKRYHARYGGEGAVRGLKKYGLRVAARDEKITKPRSAKSTAKLAAPKQEITSPRIAARPLQPKVSAPRIVAPRIAARPSNPKSAPRIAVAARPSPPTPAPRIVVTPRPKSPIVPTARVAPRLAIVKNKPAVAPLSPRVSQTPAKPFAPRGLSPQRDSFAKTRASATPGQRVATLNSQANLWNERDGRDWNETSSTIGQRPDDSSMMLLDDGQRAIETDAPLIAPSLPIKAAPRAVVKQTVKSSAATPKAAPKKLTAAQIRARRRAQRRQQRLAQQRAREARGRAQLRSRLGSPRMMVPPLAVSGVRPISPDELMRARAEWLASRSKSAADANALTSNSALRQPRGNDNYLGVPNNDFPTGAISPSSWNGGPFIAPSDSAPSMSNFGGYRGLGGVATWAARSMATAPRPVISRGGSPRDAWLAAQKNRAKNQAQFGQTMANQALGYRGMPYIRGSASPSRGFDCSGLVYFLLRQRGFSPPRTAAGLASYGNRVERAKMQSGDIVLFSNTYKRGISHVGLYVGNGNFVHAARPGQGVRVDSLSSSYYRSKFHSARRAR